MPEFHRLKVHKVVKETIDTVSVSFELPKELTNKYQFIQGQYLTLKTTIQGEEVRRSYSLCSSPLDNELKVAIKKVPEGKFSTYANEELKEGDQLDVMTPMGNFYTELNNTNQKSYLFFAAGSGITPVLSIIKTILKTEPASSIILCYGNKNFESIIFREQLEALKNKHLERFSLYHILSREIQGVDLFYGRIDAERCQQLCKGLIDISQVDECFVCGPESMIFGVKDSLEAQGFNPKNIHFELFTTPGQEKKQQKVKSTEPTFDTSITIIMDGDHYEFPLTSDGDNVLDAAVKQGADLPFACKGGVCCTCRAKLIEGEVEMDVNYALEQDELDRGFILTCQAHPRTKKVVISFDEK